MIRIFSIIVLIVFAWIVIHGKTTCSIATFENFDYEHVIDFREKPLRLKYLRGAVTNDQGGWPENVEIILQLIDHKGNLIKKIAQEDGSFDFENLTAGTYCLKVSCIGWNSFISEICISRSGKRKVDISLNLAH